MNSTVNASVALSTIVIENKLRDNHIERSKTINFTSRRGRINVDGSNIDAN